jgi:hypothetical protein
VRQLSIEYALCLRATTRTRSNTLAASLKVARSVRRIPACVLFVGDGKLRRAVSSYSPAVTGVRRNTHRVPSQYDGGLPHRVRQPPSPRLGARKLIQLGLQVLDRLRNDCCAHAVHPRPLVRGSTNVTGRVSGRDPRLPKSHWRSRKSRSR